MVLHLFINPQNQHYLKLTKREGVRILSLFIETKASPNAHPKNESNKYSPRLYRNMRIQHGHPLNVYDKVSVFVYFSLGFKIWRFYVPEKKQITLSRSGFLPWTIQNYNFNAKRETFEQEKERIVGLHSSESW